MISKTVQEYRALPLSKLPTDATALARFLIGVTLVRRIGRSIMTGRIVETEAYLPGDPASHGFNGETERNRSIFLEGGHAYIYRIYGAWWCLNVSAGEAGVGAGVLIRALQPLSGLATMQRRRPAPTVRNLLRGPGRLCDVLAIDRDLDGIDLTDNNKLWLSDRHVPKRIGQSVRIGLTKAKDARLRFYERDSTFLSGPAGLNS